MSKVLLVTDYSGTFHIVPTGNKGYYQGRNAAIKDKQYRLKEMEEDEAHQLVKDNNGVDPNFKTPSQVSKVIEDKDSEISELRKQLEEAQKVNPEMEKLRAQLAEMSKASTSTGAYVKAAEGTNADTKQGDSGTGEQEKAADLISKINAATTAEEVKNLLPANESRVTVTTAASKKLDELKAK